jgi:hypothetical protein
VDNPTPICDDLSEWMAIHEDVHAIQDTKGQPGKPSRLTPEYIAETLRHEQAGYTGSMPKALSAQPYRSVIGVKPRFQNSQPNMTENKNTQTDSQTHGEKTPDLPPEKHHQLWHPGQKIMVSVKESLLTAFLQQGYIQQGG